MTSIENVSKIRGERSKDFQNFSSFGKLAAGTIMISELLQETEKSFFPPKIDYENE